MKNKEKYDLKELKAKWIDNESFEIYADDGVYRMNSNSNAILLRGLINWLEDEYKVPILDKKEKEYLSAVIRPWRDKVDCIRKQRLLTEENYEFIRIVYRDTTRTARIELPNFEKGTMYKGMELGKEYSLEELGL